MTERSQQPLRKPHVIIEKKNPSNEKRSLEDTIPLQSKPRPAHRNILETSEENYETSEENYEEEENVKEDPTFDEYHSMKEKREDNNSEPKSTNDSTRVNHLPNWPIHVVRNQPLDCSRCQPKPVKEKTHI